MFVTALVKMRNPGGHAVEGWVHEVKHDGYRLQIHVGKGRVRLYTINGADWTERYPRVVEEVRRIKLPCVIDAEVICTDDEGPADFERLHSRCFEHEAEARRKASEAAWCAIPKTASSRIKGTWCWQFEITSPIICW